MTISTNTDSEICGLKKQVKRQRRHVQEGPNSSSCELCIRRNSERGKSRPAVSADDRRLRPIRIVQVGHGGPAAAAAVARRGVFLGSQFSQSLVSQFSRPLVCAVDGLGSQCVPPSLPPSDRRRDQQPATSIFSTPPRPQSCSATATEESFGVRSLLREGKKEKKSVQKYM